MGSRVWPCGVTWRHVEGLLYITRDQMWAKPRPTFEPGGEVPSGLLDVCSMFARSCKRGYYWQSSRLTGGSLHGNSTPPSGCPWEKVGARWRRTYLEPKESKDSNDAVVVRDRVTQKAAEGYDKHDRPTNKQTFRARLPLPPLPLLLVLQPGRRWDSISNFSRPSVWTASQT